MGAVASGRGNTRHRPKRPYSSVDRSIFRSLCGVQAAARTILETSASASQFTAILRRSILALAQRGNGNEVAMRARSVTGSDRLPSFFLAASVLLVLAAWLTGLVYIAVSYL